MGKKAEPEVEVDVEFDTDWAKVRRWRETQFKQVGIDKFAAFRLAMVPDLDWHKVVQQKRQGAADELLVEMYVD